MLGTDAWNSAPMGGPPACCLSLEIASRISHHFFSPIGVTPSAAAQVSWGFGSRGMVPGRVEVPEGRLVSYHPLSRSCTGQRCRVIVLLCADVLPWMPACLTAEPALTPCVCTKPTGHTEEHGGGHKFEQSLYCTT